MIALAACSWTFELDIKHESLITKTKYLGGCVLLELVPPNFGNNKIKVKTITVETFLPLKNITSWNEVNTLIYSSGDWSELQVTGLPSKYLPLDAALFIRLNGMVHNQSYIHIVFTPNRAYIQNQEQFYYLQISRLHQSFFHRCDNKVFERFTRFKDVDEHIISIHCDRLANVTQQVSLFFTH